MINLFSARNLLIAVGVAAFALIAAGLAIGIWLNLHPCPLCIFQRVLYLLLGAFALLAAAFFGRPTIRMALSWLAFFSGAGGVATASYQTWLQANPAPGLECGFADPTLIERLVDWLGQLWPFMFLATGFCSSKEWVFLGLSMANWSIICFGALALMLVPLLRRRVGMLR